MMKISSWSCLVSVQVERKVDMGVALDTITVEDVVEVYGGADMALNVVLKIMQDVYNVDTKKALVLRVEIQEPK